MYLFSVALCDLISDEDFQVSVNCGIDFEI